MSISYDINDNASISWRKISDDNTEDHDNDTATPEVKI